MAQAYALACELFAASLRPSGKTFLAHVIGTASIAVDSGASADQAIAAILHAAYFHGDFGDGRTGTTDEKRAEVQRVVGPDAERLINDYAAWPWRERLAVLLHDGAAALGPDERPIAHLRVANEIEDSLDLAVAYVPGRNTWVLPLADAAECARRLDLPRLATIADEVAAANAGREVPAGLQRATIASAHVPPRSLSPNLRVRVRDGLALARPIVRRIPGARRVRDWIRDATPTRHR